MKGQSGKSVVVLSVFRVSVAFPGFDVYASIDDAFAVPEAYHPKLLAPSPPVLKSCSVPESNVSLSGVLVVVVVVGAAVVVVVVVVGAAVVVVVGAAVVVVVGALVVVVVGEAVVVVVGAPVVVVVVVAPVSRSVRIIMSGSVIPAMRSFCCVKLEASFTCFLGTNAMYDSY